MFPPGTNLHIKLPGSTQKIPAGEEKEVEAVDQDGKEIQKTCQLNLGQQHQGLHLGTTPDAQLLGLFTVLPTLAGVPID